MYNPSRALPLQAQTALRSFLREAGAALDQCSTAQDAACVLELLHHVLPLPGEHAKEVSTHQLQTGSGEPRSTTPHDSKIAQQLRLHATAVEASGQSGAALLASAYWQCFEQLTALLLTAMEAPWWSDLPVHLQQVCTSYLEAAPAPVLLHGLLGYISCVTPSATSGSSSRVQVTAVGASTAAHILQQRFSSTMQNRGVHELLLYMTSMQSPTGHRQLQQQAAMHNCQAGAAASQSPSSCTAATQPVNGQPHDDAACQPILLLPPGWNPTAHLFSPVLPSQASESVQSLDTLVYASQGSSQQHAYQHVVGCSTVAGLLVSLPDRLAAFRQEGMDHGSFYPYVMQQLMVAAADPVQTIMTATTTQPGTSQRESRQHDTAQHDGAARLNGHVQHVGDQQQETGAFSEKKAESPSEPLAIAVAGTAAQLCAEVMRRLCGRGATNMVADALLHSLHTATLNQPGHCNGNTTSNGLTKVAPRTSNLSNTNDAAAISTTASGASSGSASAFASGSGSGFSSMTHAKATHWPEPCDVLPVVAQAMTTYLLSMPSLTTKLLQALFIAHARAHAGQLPTDPSAPASLTGAEQGPGATTSPQQQQQQQATEAAAAQLLQLIGGSHAVASQTELRYALTEQLAARIPLPTPAMHLLVRLLLLASRQSLQPAAQQGHAAFRVNQSMPGSSDQCCYGPLTADWWLQQLVNGPTGLLASCSAGVSLQTNHSTGSAGRTAKVHDTDSTADAQGISSTDEVVDLGEVLAGLASLWGDVAPLGASQRHGNMQATAVGGRSPPPGIGPEAQAATARAGSALPQQAYLSCVLLQLLAGLQKQQLERVPGLLAQLLSGVSHRLGSPLLSVRRQAMRVGQALSAVLDPDSSTKLFQDQGPLNVLSPEELWPGALPATYHPSAASTQHKSAARSANVQASPSKASPSNPSAGVDAAHSASPSSATRNTQAGGNRGENGGYGAHVSAAADSDDEVSGMSDGSEVDSDDEDSLEAYDLHEDTQAEAWDQADPKSLQLRAIAAALRKSDAVQGILEALPKVELLVRAAPDELPACATELTRALIHCRAPEWVQKEPHAKAEDAPEVQRSLALAALTATTPLPAGDALLAEVLSPHLDTSQRLLCLQTLAAAAQELSNPGVAPRVEYTPGQLPRLVYPHMGQAPDSQPQLTGGSSSTPAALPGPAGTSSTARSNAAASRSRANSSAVGRDSSSSALQAGKTRVWGHVALRKRAEQPKQAQRNSFADVALRWTYGLLREVDVVKHGVDILHRDSLLLVGLLHTLGVFAECSSLTPAAWPVCNAVMELLAAPQVHGHAEVAVRRAALLTAGQVLAGLPASRAAAALLANDSRPVPLLGGSKPSAEDATFTQRLRWMQGWLELVHHEDADPHCRAMAAACTQLHNAMAADAAMQALTLDDGPWPGLQGSSGSSAAQLLPVGSVTAGPLGVVRQAQIVLPHHLYSTT